MILFFLTGTPSTEAFQGSCEKSSRWDSVAKDSVVVTQDCMVCVTPAHWGDDLNDLVEGALCTTTLDTAYAQLQVTGTALSACTAAVASYKGSSLECRRSLDLKDSVVKWQTMQLLKKDSIAESFRRERDSRPDPMPWKVATVALAILSSYLLYVVGR